MRGRIFPFRATVVLSIVGISGVSATSQHTGNAEAKAVFDKGELALRSDQYDEAIGDFRKAISVDPNFAQAHDEYIAMRQDQAYRALRAKAAGSESFNPTHQDLNRAKSELQQITKRLVNEYETLAREHPGSPIYVWALGKIYERTEPARRESYCRQAIAVDSKFALGFECLASMAYRRGDDKEAIRNQKQAVALLPNDADQFFTYTYYHNGDRTAYKSATEEMLRKFPDSPRSAQALYWYALDQGTDAAQIEEFERLRKLYPPEKFEWSESGSWDLFHLYNRSDPAKAQALAQDMLKVFPKDDDWIDYAAYADAMVKAAQEVEDRPANALATIRSIKNPGRLVDTRRKDLLQARALDLEHNTAEAYTFLVSRYAKHPSEEVRTGIEQYGNKLGKTNREIAIGIWSAITASSTPAIPFSLPDFTDGKNVSLADYKGHVVVLEFWYPTCGPCRQAFPYLQQIAAKFKDRGVVVLAINQDELENFLVLPLLKSKRYDFIPLKGTREWVSKRYKVLSFPSTFLVGPDGRVYFRPQFRNRSEERTAELEIEEMLAHPR